jgi:hypothetical protein
MPPSFQKYCDGTDTWLAWVFCMDFEQNFILASNASSRLPSHLTKEGGFGESNHDSPHAGGSNMGLISTEQKIEAAIKNQQTTAALINSAIGGVRLIIGRHANPTTMSAVVSCDCCQTCVQKYKTLRQDFDANDDLSPESKDV